MTKRPTDDGRWALRRLLLEVWGRFARARRELPPGALGRFGISLAVGAAVLAAFDAAGALALSVAWEGPAPAWELALMRQVDELPLRALADWLAPFGNGFITLPLMLFASGMAAWMGRPRLSLAAFPGYLLTFVLVLLGWVLWPRPRPEAVLHGLEAAAAFPSGHMVNAAFAYGLLCWLWGRVATGRGERSAALGLWLLLLTLTAVSRLWTLQHWPTDVVAGTLLGTAWLAVVVGTLRRDEGGSSGKCISPRAGASAGRQGA